MEKERKVAMKANIQIVEPFTSEIRTEEVFVQQEHSGDIPKEISDASNLTNYIESTTPKEVDTFGKEMEGYIIPDHYKTYLWSLQPGQERVELTVAKESLVEINWMGNYHTTIFLGTRGMRKKRWG